MLTASNLEFFLGHFHLGVLALVWSSPNSQLPATWEIIHLSIGGEAQLVFRVCTTKKSDPFSVEGSGHKTSC